MERIFDCHPQKRETILRERFFDLRDMAEIFGDPNRLELIDRRFDYGEERRIVIGKALGRVFTLVYTERPPVTWLITAWPANRKERERYENR